MRQHKGARRLDRAIQSNCRIAGWPGRSPVLTLRLWVPVIALLFAATFFFTFSASQAAERRHGLSAFGDLKYPRTSPFDYVNPDAPKGGRMATLPASSINTFNEFNGFILRGDAAEGVELFFNSLMVRSQDEPDAVYGLIAESAEVADDKMSVTFYLGPRRAFAIEPRLRRRMWRSRLNSEAEGPPALSARLARRGKRSRDRPGNDQVSIQGRECS